MELVIFAILLFIVIVVWGLSSISQSLATAKQAQATIETARAAQVASTGNLITILVTALVILVILTIIGFGLWLFFQVRVKPTLKRAGLFPGNGRAIFGQQHNQPELTGRDPLGQLTQLITLQMLQQMQRDVRQQRQEQPAQLEEDENQWFLPM
jgi:flagellar biosynthesis protein FlhB